MHGGCRDGHMRTAVSPGIARILKCVCAPPFLGTLPRARCSHPLPCRPVCESRRAFGSEVVRGLFRDGRKGNLEPKSNAPLVKTEVKFNTLRRLRPPTHTHTRLRTTTARQACMLSFFSISQLCSVFGVFFLWRTHCEYQVVHPANRKNRARRRQRHVESQALKCQAVPYSCERHFGDKQKRI